jgi:hypothetical protein
VKSLTKYPNPTRWSTVFLAIALKGGLALTSAQQVVTSATTTYATPAQVQIDAAA